SGLSGSSGSGIETVVARGARGNAGALTLETKRLRLQDQAAITSATNGSGNANNLTVQARDSVFLTDNSRLSTQTQGGGEAGNLALTTNLLTLQNGGQLIVSGQGRFSSGNLAVNANSIRLNNQASLRAETEAGDRGSIFLNAQDIVLRRNSTITTNATNSATGGNITINADILLLTENSAIVAQAMFGRGGNITITAQGLFQLLGTRIDASSELGIDGVVQINTPDVDPSRQLVELPSDLLDSQRLIANSCLVPSDRRQGTFVLTGVGGLPSLPTSPLRSPFETYAVPANAAVSAQSRSNHQNSNPVTEIQDIYRLENGQLMLGRRCP
ncbi:S-layer family protein, partial [Leptolyngbya sp. FACHB-36]|nr:S-layer family protein [Leptolyngbya sp. FACHB-36]